MIQIIISKIFNFLKSLFSILRVIMALGHRRDKVEEDGSNPRAEDSKTEKGNINGKEH